MRKSIYQRENEILRALLRSWREDAGMVQEQVSDSLGKPQSYISKIERGERRLDVLELRVLCRLYGKDLSAFARQLEAALNAEQQLPSRSR